ncbi:biotin holocarboxylase synthetase [Nowakowskiella sp. JEL0078]|nr:biotin holocarboxylase synthetase [Nowakowskiella sp. JEL0078]
MNVLVYTGPGTARTTFLQTLASLRTHLSSTYDVIPVDAPTLLNEPWEPSCVLLVLPGGRDIPYTQHLSPRGTARIAAYIRSGGSYLGICAGAYFGAARVEFEEGRTGYEVIGSRDLKFYNGVARGAAFPGFVYGSERGAHAVRLIGGIVSNLNTWVYVNGGPFFVGDGTEATQVLAWFADEGDVKRAAVVEVRVGAGTVVLSGPHVEIEGGEGDLGLKLRLGEPGRRAFFRCILKRLGLRLEEEAIDGKITPIFFVTEGSDVTRFERIGIKEDGKVVLKDSNNTFWIWNGIQNNQLRLEMNSSDEIVSFGSDILYGEVMGSTQTLLEKNVKFLEDLSSGTVCVASHQVAGRGRGKNSWISQSGCLQFSLYVRHIGSTGLIFLQYLVALAVVKAIKSKPGYEFTKLPIFLKWPNDIYARISPGNEGLLKIGGILVNSSYQNGVFSLVLGCGINITNTRPTLSINDLIKLHNSELKGSDVILEPLSVEETLTRILTTFEVMYRKFISDCGSDPSKPFRRFADDYYDVWLHRDQHVSITESTSVTGELQYAVIVGLDNSGMLAAEITSYGPSLGSRILLQPDGNSFDMMQGLIKRKA